MMSLDTLEKEHTNLQALKQKVETAKRAKKVFILSYWAFVDIKNSLVSRGWVEKVEARYMAYVEKGSERFLIAALLENTEPDFIWQSENRPINRNENRPSFMNSIVREAIFDYTYKIGLKMCADAIGWHHIDGIAELCYLPRTFILNDQSEKDEFLNEFTNTAFTSFIKFLNDQQILSDLFSTNGTLSTECIEFAIKKVYLMIRIKEHADIDLTAAFDYCYRYPRDQDMYQNEISQMIKGFKKFKLEDEKTIKVWKMRIKVCADEIEHHWPHLRYDGYSNIWIFKPSNLYQGKGIVIEKNMDKIQKIMSDEKETFVAQKYIERPLIIHDRKFDIRIFTLTTILNRSINVWIYKDCYLKFTVLPFSLINLDRSVHVTNFSIQKHFLTLHNSVPNTVDCRWNLNQLTEYFASVGKPNIWESKIYPSLKKGLIAVILPGLESTLMEHKAFELHGADVMITDDFEPVIIEINTSPSLHGWPHVNPISAKLSEDVIKVVIDYSKDKKASTGDFELVLSKEIPDTDIEMNDMEIIGEKLLINSISKTEAQNDIGTQIEHAIQSY